MPNNYKFELIFCENRKFVRKFVIVWQTRKIRSLFPLKDKSKYPSCVIYEGVCSCGEVYIGETDRNCDVRWDEHDTPSEKSDPAKHLLKNPTHKFSWKVLTSAPKQLSKRKILEDYHILINDPKINEQIQSNKIKLFRHGGT